MKHKLSDEIAQILLKFNVPMSLERLTSRVTLTQHASRIRMTLEEMEHRREVVFYLQAYGTRQGYALTTTGVNKYSQEVAA